MIHYKTKPEIELMRISCLLVSKTLAQLAAIIRPGISTWELDQIAEQFIRDNGATPSFKGYGNPAFPFACCMSVNDAVVHGFPTKTALKEGDIISVDVGTFINGFHGDSAGYGVVRELVGHGVGRHLHEEPQVPNYGKRGTGAKLKEGMVIAIEPMINLGTKNVYHDKDGWTIRTEDGKPAAHYEHTICIQKGAKADILSSFVEIEAAEKANANLCSDY